MRPMKWRSRHSSKDVSPSWASRVQSRKYWQRPRPAIRRRLRRCWQWMPTRARGPMPWFRQGRLQQGRICQSAPEGARSRARRLNGWRSRQEGKPLFSIMPFVVISILSTLVVLGIMVLVHEFGHFAMAKLFHVKVEVFSIGFGKRLFGFRRGDTDYRLSLLPLGGYVKMAGEMGGDGTPTGGSMPAAGDPGDFSAKPRWQRIIIGLAGPVA